MNKRKLGNSRLEVSEIGLGCMGMTHAYGPAQDKQKMIELIREAIQLGCNFFDTAVVYGEENEKILGEAIKPYRNDVMIATKFGILGQSHDLNKPINELDSRPETIRKQLEESLKRLQVDCIDVYYQHRVDPNVEPEVVATVMKELIEEGKIKTWGTSNAPIEYIRRANKVCPISVIENQYSMVWREPEKEMFDLCEELNMAFVAYSPLGNGFLTGKYSKNTKYAEGDFRNTMGRFRPEVMDHNQALLDLIATVAKTKQATSAQIVLAWELAQKPYIIPIPGSTKLNRLKENLQASEIVLTKEEMEKLNEALSKLDIDETHF